MKINTTVRTLSELVDGEIVGDPNIIISGPSKIEEGNEGTISFLSNLRYVDHIYTTKASAILVSKDFIPAKTLRTTLIKVDNVYSALTKILKNFENGQFTRGVSSLAYLDSEARIHETASVGTYAVVHKGASIGKESIIGDHVFIGASVKVGDYCILYPGVKIYHGCSIGDHCIIHANAVIGSDGFGFAPNNEGVYDKIPQIGNVIIENHVEIGANTTIDRATMGSTIIKEGVKLDNLVQVAHNVVIGEHTVIAAQTGIAGSTKIGKHCQIGGQVGIAGHLNIPDGTLIQGQSGIISNPKSIKTRIFGTPGLDYKDYLRSYAVFKKLPDMVNEIKILKKEIERLKSSK